MSDKQMVVGRIVLEKTNVPIEDLMKFTKKLIRETIIIKIPKKRLKQIESRAKRAGLSVTDYMLTAVDAFEAAFKLRNETKEANATAKRIASVILRAVNVFGSSSKARLWLNELNPALNNKTPLSLLHDDAGCRLVKNVLGQIKHGIYS